MPFPDGMRTFLEQHWRLFKAKVGRSNRASLSATIMCRLTLHPAVPGLYPFQSITFGTCGATGRLGPVNSSVCAASYAQYGSWTANPSFLSVANGIQTWTTPLSGVYSISIGGAGGNSLAATVYGTVSLQSGSQVVIVIGQAGLTGRNTQSVGGSGGTYVFLGDFGTPLMVAGDKICIPFLPLSSTSMILALQPWPPARHNTAWMLDVACPSFTFRVVCQDQQQDAKQSAVSVGAGGSASGANAPTVFDTGLPAGGAGGPSYNANANVPGGNPGDNGQLGEQTPLSFERDMRTRSV